MTTDEINVQLDAMAAEAAAQNDDTLLAGLILLSQDSYLRHSLPTTITAILHGMRFRGVRVWVSREYEDKVLTRAEALAAHGERLGVLEALEPRA
ncbi:hypothetical protein BH10PSE3_BH10PSE3_26710 [soil metagenome]|jgi:hypothetical protein